MANDPRQFLVIPCERGQKRAESATGETRDFLRALGNVGGIEGLGKIGKGLRTLTSVSNTIRTGRSVVPGREGTGYDTALNRILGTAAADLNKGANVVLDTVGLGGVVDIVAGINPNAANTGYAQAKHIYNKVKSGDYELSDIPETISELNQLETIAKSVFSPTATAPQRTVEKCGATPYAMALIDFAPKYKFLFIVQIVFTPTYQAWMDLGNDFAFVIKSSSRPSIEFDYEEVNLYNFRTQIPKRTKYKPITMTFYDDNKNNANLFYTAYLRAMSPLANNGKNVLNAITLADSSMYTNAASGTTFGSSQGGGAVPTYASGASLGTLAGEELTIIEQIKIFHVFEYGRLMNVYTFQKPKITALNLDDLTMTESGMGSEMSIDFEYDALYIEPNYAIQDTSEYDIEALTKQGDPTLAIRPEFSTSTPMIGTPNAPTSQVMEGGDAMASQSSLMGDAKSLISKAFSDPNFQTGLTKIQSAYSNITDRIGSARDKISSISDKISSSRLFG